MKKSELKALIKEVVEESLTNTNQPIDQRLSLIKGKTVSAAYIAGGGYIVITFKDGSRLEIDAKGENKFGVSFDKNIPWGQHKDDWLPGGAGDPAHDKKN
jgi:hypothetical protein